MKSLGIFCFILCCFFVRTDPIPPQCNIKIYKDSVTTDPHGYIKLTNQISNTAPFVEYKNGQVYNSFSSFRAVTQQGCELCDLIVYSTKSFSGYKQIIYFESHDKFDLAFCAKSWELDCTPSTVEKVTMDVLVESKSMANIHAFVVPTEDGGQDVEVSVDVDTEIEVTIDVDEDLVEVVEVVKDSEATVDIEVYVETNSDGGIDEMTFEVDVEVDVNVDIYVETDQQVEVDVVSTHETDFNIEVDQEVQDLPYDVNINPVGEEADVEVAVVYTP